MAYKCPPCGEPIRRGHSSVAGICGTLGYLRYWAFRSFECNTQETAAISISVEPKPKTCAEIPRSEFPSEDRIKTRIESCLFLIGA